MQETKCRPDQFPVDLFEEAGYQVAAHGLDQWNGVAIASRVGLSEVETSFPGQPSFGKPGQESTLEARAIGATCGGIRVWSVYVPNGRALDDPHYAYKLSFLSALNEAAGSWAVDDSSIAIVGDWNVAPFDTDTWDASDPSVATHVSHDVRELFFAFQDLGYQEATRLVIPEEGCYTFWEYQRLRFAKGEGMRLDYVLASPRLLTRIGDVTIDRDERKGAGASDHVPVLVDFSDDPGSVEP